MAALVSVPRELVCVTDDVAQRIDEIQFTVGEGPCLDAYTSQLPQLCAHLAAPGHRNRWLAFGAEVQELGVQAVFAFPMPGVEHCLGVLDLYRRACVRSDGRRPTGVREPLRLRRRSDHSGRRGAFGSLVEATLRDEEALLQSADQCGGDGYGVQRRWSPASGACVPRMR